IKNHAYRDSKIKYELGSPLSPDVTFEDNLANELKDNNLGLLLHVGSAYINKSSLETYCYDEEHKQFNNTSSYDLRSKSNSTYDLFKHNRLVACGLDSFNITTEYKIIFQSLLHSWTDPIRLAKEEYNVEQFLHQMMPCTYSKKRFCDDDEEESYKKSKQE
ncbi:5456_t:CDS:2, partial [Funneliformis caledonium]